MLLCKMMRSNKGGHMITIAVGFLLETLALMVATVLDR